MQIQVFYCNCIYMCITSKSICICTILKVIYRDFVSQRKRIGNRAIHCPSYRPSYRLSMFVKCDLSICYYDAICVFLSVTVSLFA